VLLFYSHAVASLFFSVRLKRSIAPFDAGKFGIDLKCLTPCRSSMDLKGSPLNSGPLSLVIVSESFTSELNMRFSSALATVADLLFDIGTALPNFVNGSIPTIKYLILPFAGGNSNKSMA
jgi:hypothetical protein